MIFSSTIVIMRQPMGLRLWVQMLRRVAFVEVARFVVSYPDSSTVVHVLMQATHLPCTHCSFRILEGPEMDVLSIFAHSTKIHSANTSYPRGILKNEALRVAVIINNGRNLMGTQAGSFDAIHTLYLSPLLRLWEKRSFSVRDIQRSFAIPVDLFELYSRNLVAPRPPFHRFDY